MDEELQIALIAASSAIGGGLITGLLSILSDTFRSRREERHKIAEERRKAYIDLSHTLNACFPHPDPTITLSDLNQVAARVQIVGSEGVARAAQEARNNVGVFMLAQDFKPRINPFKLLQQKSEIAIKALESIEQFQNLARNDQS